MFIVCTRIIKYKIIHLLYRESNWTNKK